MKLVEWKRGLRPGLKLSCIYRWYWGMGNPASHGYKAAPESGREACEVIEVRTTQLIMKTPTAARSWMQFPKASELKATTQGFELYFPVDPRLDDLNQGPARSGKLMSRYQYDR